MEHNQSGAGKKTLIQFLKFNLVGVLNTIVDFVVFQILNLLLGWPKYLSQIISYSCGVANSYLFNSRWTFRETRSKSVREAVLFVAVNLVSLGVSLGVMWLCGNVFGVTNEWAAGWMPAFLTKFVTGDTIAKLIATVFSVVVNYIGNRLFVFNRRAEA